MIQRIKNLVGNNLLIKVASLNSVAVALRILGGLLTSKFIALFVGPSGLALLGNFRDFISVIQSFSTLGLYNGIIKYVAELKDRASELSKLISTVVILQMCVIALISTIIFLFAPVINDYVFSGQGTYIYLIRLLAVMIPFYSAKTLFFAWLNGHSKFKRLLYVNIAAQIVGVSMNCLLIWQFGLEGALISIVVIEVLLFLLAIFAIIGLEVHFPKIKRTNFKTDVLRNLGSFAIMALLSAILLPAASVFIRNYIIDNLGYKEAGFWVAMTRISDYYLMFIISLISMYVLPKLSQAKTDSQFRTEIFSFYKSIVPIFVLGLIVIYLLKSFIIQIVFSSEFSSVTSLFKWQLSGDLLRVMAMVIAYQFLAKKMVWHYVITEIISILVLVIASVLLIDQYGVEGATMGHLVSYIVYIIMIIAIFYKPLFVRRRL